MRLIRNIENYQPVGPLYLALGNFDGVHRGHQALIKACVEAARSNQGVAAAYIFEPHPAKVIKPDQAPRLLVTPERKAELLDALGLDLLIYTPFTMEVAKMLPEEFVRDILVDRLGVKEAVVGFNYSFGYRGQGTPDMLAAFGQEFGFQVTIVDPVDINGQIVSSSAVRSALDAGDIEQAVDMLGYHPSWTGMVTEGEHRGSKIGFPTANLEVNPELSLPGHGVYAALAQVNQRSYKAVVNVGRKPTFHDQYPTTIEVHLIDFKDDIYGQQLTISLIKKIRDERKFNNVDELVAQIAADRDSARDMAIIPS